MKFFFLFLYPSIILFFQGSLFSACLKTINNPSYLLSAYWSMDSEKEGSENVIPDLTIGDRDIVLFRGASIGISRGKFHGALELDGNNDYGTTLGHKPLVPTGRNNFTVSAWIYDTKGTGYREIISSWHVSNNSFFFGLNGYQNVRFSDSWSSVDVDIEQDKWMNIVVVSTNTNAYIYVNGTLKAEKHSPLTYTSLGNLYFGRQGLIDGEFFGGKIDDVAIWNRALSSNDIQSLFTSQCSLSEMITETSN